ncbi:hypothetical protein AMTRI_Chr10g225170 [Amborella trichopoda]
MANNDPHLSVSFVPSDASARDELLDPLASHGPTSKPSKFQPKFKPRPNSRNPNPQANSNGTVSEPSASLNQGPSVKQKPPEISETIDQGFSMGKGAKGIAEVMAKVKLEPTENGVSRVKMEEDVELKVKKDSMEEVMEEAKVDMEIESEGLGSSDSSWKGGEDRLVRTIDLFLVPSPIDPDTKLYINQYPLRACWRPYEFDERCQEVRIRPKQSKVEFDLTVDDKSPYYDPNTDDDMRITKQTLTSMEASLATGYGVGILSGSKLFLNRVQAVLQLRPSMDHLKKSAQDSRKNDSRTSEEPTTSNKKSKQESVGPSKIQATDEGQKASTSREDEPEPWITLEYHGMESPTRDYFWQKMVTEENSQQQLFMSVNHYITSWIPGRDSAPLERACINHGRGGSDSSLSDALSLEEHIKLLLSKGQNEILPFEILMRHAPVGLTEQEVLKVLQKHAHLVQGYWVPKSPLRYEAEYCKVRDYILLLFHKERVIQHDEVKGLLSWKTEIFEKVMNPLGSRNRELKRWEFKLPTQKSFLQSHENVVEDQSRLWSSLEKHLMDSLPWLKNKASNSRVSSKINTKGSSSVAPLSGRGDQPAKSVADGAQISERSIMSEEVREAISDALRDVFKKYHVCSLPMLRSGLRDLGISKSVTPKAATRVAAAAAHGAAASDAELLSHVNKVAVNIHGVYALKSLSNPLLDPLREVVISLLCASKPKAKLKKVEVMQAFKIKFNKEDVPPNVYKQVLTELCVSQAGGWVLKSGDGRPL